jgi:hypothetical protein
MFSTSYNTFSLFARNLKFILFVVFRLQMTWFLMFSLMTLISKKSKTLQHKVPLRSVSPLCLINDIITFWICVSFLDGSTNIKEEDHIPVIKQLILNYLLHKSRVDPSALYARFEMEIILPIEKYYIYLFVF